MLSKVSSTLFHNKIFLFYSIIPHFMNEIRLGSLVGVNLGNNDQNSVSKEYLLFIRLLPFEKIHCRIWFPKKA